jgi:hypothetical protein
VMPDSSTATHEEVPNQTPSETLNYETPQPVDNFFMSNTRS